MAHSSTPAKRGAVTEFSAASRKRLAFVAYNTDVDFRTIITLTYPAVFPKTGAQVKRDLMAFKRWLRRDYGGPYSYLWALEFQDRHAPHFHFLTDHPFPRRMDDKSAFRFRIASAWYRIVASGDEKHLLAGTSAEGVRFRRGGNHYLAKYAAKLRQKKVPDDFHLVGRMWGCSRDVMPTPIETLPTTERDIKAALVDWDHYRGDKHPVFQTIYGASNIIKEYLGEEETV